MIRIAVSTLSKRGLEARYRATAAHYRAILDGARAGLAALVTGSSTSGIFVKARLKSFESLFEKVLRKAREQPDEQEIQISDLLGLRVVCPFIEDAVRAEESVRSHYPIIERERKGQEYSPREFGYESTHLLVRLPPPDALAGLVPDELVAEIQVRTLLQDAWAEVEHQLMYKAEFTPFDEPLRRKLAAVNANLSLSDIIFQEIRDYQRRFQNERRVRRTSFHSRINSPSSVKGGQLPIVSSPLIETVDNLLLAALSLHNQGDYKGAVGIYSRLLKSAEREKVRAVIYVHRGMAHFGDARFSEAIADFSAAIELDPNNLRAFYYRGVVHRVTRDLERALADFDRALEIDPFHFDPLFARAQVYFALGDMVQAHHNCSRALSLRPESEEALRFLEVITRRIQA